MISLKTRLTREEAKDLLLNISAYDIDMQRGMAKKEAIDMAIKALEQKPCEDAISRQAAIDAMAKWDWQELYLPIHFKQLLEELPSVSTEKTGRWIPVSERLPELLEDVLICDSGGCINIGFCTKRKYASGKEYTSWVEVGSDWDATPIAWMPLPTPYEPQESEV